MILKVVLILLISLNVYSQSCELYKSDLGQIKACKPNRVHLTFDDGPNTNTTPKIIRTLKKQKVDATFFISTHQLEKGDLDKKSELLNEILQNKFTLASHGHDHNCHDIRYDWSGNLQEGYNDKERRIQISKSIKLLNQFTNKQFSKQDLKLIRFPYGRGISPSPKEIEKMIKDGRDIRGSNYAEKLHYYRAHSPAMSIASEYELSHVGWNHDSKDATTKYSAKNQDEYIDFQLRSFCRSSSKNIVALYHDTRPINSSPSKYDSTKTVMDEIIEKSKCLGIEFVSAKEIFSKDLQAGVFTPSYNAIDKVSEMIKETEKLKVSNNPSCNTKVLENTQGNSCYSKYVGEVKHCHGNESFCIDGQWIKSSKLYEATCKGNLNSVTAKKLSSNYLGKSCDVPSKSIEIGKSKCYCQYKDEKLIWNCYDISSGVAKALF